ncbi:MAG: iron-containing alcohol dehydrogenase [Bacilli bacterium]
MNIFYKLYARTFQVCFRIAIPLLPYRSPKVYNDISDLSKILDKNDKPLIVTDQAIISAGLLEYVLQPLYEKGIKYSIFSHVCPNPTSDVVDEALALFKKDNCSCFIALGGGSVIDTAKAIGARYVRPNKELKDLAGILHVRKKIPTLMAIPTTCGTGSETTLASVVIDSKTRHKFAINDFPLIPKYAFLDYRVIEKLPERLIYTTGLDALTHALEAYIGRSTTKDTRKDALEAIKLIFENILEAKDRKKENLQNMMEASFKAGRAFTKSYVGYVHAIAHSLGGKYDIPHGYANAVILPYVLREYGKAIYKKIARIYDYLNMGDLKISNKEKYEVFMNKLDALERNLGIDTTISCIKEEDISSMANYALKEANPLYPVPVIWNKKKMVSMYYKIQGK